MNPKLASSRLPASPAWLPPPALPVTPTSAWQGLIAHARALVARWQQWRLHEQLLEMDPRVLRDIGAPPELMAEAAGRREADRLRRIEMRLGVGPGEGGYAPHPAAWQDLGR